MDYNSITNQEIKDKFVSREIYANVNSMVNYILAQCDYDENAPFTIDDIENYYEKACPKCGSYCFTQHVVSSSSDYEYFCDDCQAEFNYPDELPAEIFEWWRVSPWLLEKLAAKGQPVIFHESLWGRCTTGQAILLDSVISEICEDLEILEGQKHSWA